MKKPSQKIPILDLTGLTSCQRYHGNPYELVMQGTRGVAMFEANEKFYEISEKFNRNELIPVIDFLQAQREVKAELMALKRGHSENVKGQRYENFNR
jgi:hypothetical protein